MTTAIRIENVSKLYRLGTVGTGTISHDLNRWWHQIRGKEDPYAKIGQVNDRTKKAGESSVASRQSSATANCQLPTDDSRGLGPDYVWALKDINLEVQQGEILGIIGRNGAGKSTLLKLLSRVTAPTTGSIKTKGRIASLLEVGTGFHPDLTGRENIYMNGAILGMRRTEITRQLEEIVEFSGCAKYLDTPVKRYSSGMTVRLGFAVAAHLQCEILIVDEVLAVGDAEFQKKCIGKMRDVALKGRTVVFVSHSMPAVQGFCTRGILMNQGKIAFEGLVNNVISQYMASARGSAKTDLTTREDRGGNGSARVTAVACSNADSSQSAITCSSRLRIEVSYDMISRDNRVPTIAIGIYDEMQSKLLFLCSEHDLEFVAAGSGRGLVRCETDPINLSPGDCVVNVALIHGPSDSGILLDYVETAAVFRIEAEDFFGTGKLPLRTWSPCLLHSKWANGDEVIDV